MTRLTAALLLTLTLATAPALANDPPDKPAEKTVPKIEGPARKSAPIQPAPVVAADTPLVMEPSQRCMFGALIPCRVFVSPPGLVSVEHTNGPVKVKARLVDGAGEYELIYDKPHVWYVEAKQAGLCEVLIIPDDPKEQTFRRLIQIGPRPPPGPDPGPDPTPLPDSLMTPLRGAWGEETDAAKLDHKAALASIYRKSINSLNNKKLVTVGQLYAAIREASSAMLPDTALPRVRATLGEYLKANAPIAPSQPLDDLTRAQLGTVFGQIAQGLEVLK